MSSKDSIEREKKKPHLKLAKQGARTKMVVSSDKNLQENGTNWKLRLRGRRLHPSILIWGFLALTCKEKKEEEEGVSTTGLKRIVAGK